MMVQLWIVMDICLAFQSTVRIITSIYNSTHSAVKQTHRAHYTWFPCDNYITVRTQIGIFLGGTFSSQTRTQLIASPPDSTEAAMIEKHVTPIVTTLGQYRPIRVKDHHSNRCVTVAACFLSQVKRSPHGIFIFILFDVRERRWMTRRIVVDRPQSSTFQELLFRFGRKGRNGDLGNRSRCKIWDHRNWYLQNLLANQGT